MGKSEAGREPDPAYFIHYVNATCYYNEANGRLCPSRKARRVLLLCR